MSSIGLHPLLMKSKDDCETAPSIPPSVTIHFSCDKSQGLGQPLKVLSQPCVTTFNWPTTAACHGQQKFAHENDHPILTKCYLYDDNGNERNLKSLIHKDGHRVIIPPAVNSTTSLQEEIFINICSEVSNSCHGGMRSALGSSGTAACAIVGTRTDVLSDVRKFSMKYDNRSDEVVIKYEESGNRSNCQPDGFITIIRLKCPSPTRLSYYAMDSRQPFLVSRTECEMIIEWETDYACPVQTYSGDMTNCIITGQDLQIDLKPLRKQGNGFYLLKNITVEEYSSNETINHDIAFNICGGLPTNNMSYCGKTEWRSSSVCRRPTNGGGGEVIGNTKRASLTMTDGNVVLVYPLGVPCFIDRSKQYQTIISFTCPEEAEQEGPSFDFYDDCTHFITFKSRQVCLPDNRYEAISCSVTDPKGVLYDLSPLRQGNVEHLWKVDTASFLAKNGNNSRVKEMYINVCGGIPKIHKLNNICQNLAEERLTAACLFDPSENTSRSAGEFYEKPFFYGDSLSLEYKNETEKVATLIHFKCHPGVSDTSPVLSNVTTSSQTTIYNLMWETGAACPLKTFEGSHCQVFDQDLGLLLDLNPLFKEHADYTVIEGNYKYHLNFCGPVKGSPCPGDNVAVCQEEIGKGRNWTLGTVNQDVKYFNGMLSMSFKNGTPYNNPARTPRKTDVIFVCDNERNDTLIEMVSEQNRTYTFRVLTGQACPHEQNTLPCLWQNGTHSVDLGLLSLEDNNHHHPIINRQKGTNSIYYFNFCRPVNPIRNWREHKHPCRPGSGVCRTAYDASNDHSLSMGVPFTSPQTMPDGNFSLLYNNGDPCPDDNSTRMTSMVNFFCDQHEGDGFVAAVREGKCSVEIDFVTAFICEAFPDLKFSSEKKSPSSVTTAPSKDSFETATKTNKDLSSANETNVLPIHPSRLDNNTRGQVHQRQTDGYSVLGLLVVILMACLSVSLALIILINSETR